MIRITAKRPGFRRAGIAHPAEPTAYPDDAFSHDQITALVNEPMLVVEHFEGNPDADPAPLPPVSNEERQAEGTGKPNDGIEARVGEEATLEEPDPKPDNNKRKPTGRRRKPAARKPAAAKT